MEGNAKPRKEKVVVLTKTWLSAKIFIHTDWVSLNFPESER